VSQTLKFRRIIRVGEQIEVEIASVGSKSLGGSNDLHEGESRGAYRQFRCIIRKCDGKESDRSDVGGLRRLDRGDLGLAVGTGTKDWEERPPPSPLGTHEHAVEGTALVKL
jgi:hypothetical protein